MGATFTPEQVGLSPTSGGQVRPYMPISGWEDKPSIPIANATSNVPNRMPSNVLGAETVRATGDGPFDQTYRQNLATYEGGLFNRPGGNLSINPTGSNLFGNPTGAGNAPVPGMPTGLLDMGLAGMGFTAPQPPPQPTPDTSSMGAPNGDDSWKFWLNNFSDNGSMFNKASSL